MNTKNEKDQKKKQIERLPERESKKQPQNWDMWEMLHGDMKNHEHERPEARLTR